MAAYTQNWTHQSDLNKPIAGVIYSGGLDSTVVCGDLIEQGHHVIPMIMDTGSFQTEHVLKPATLSSLRSLNILKNSMTLRMPNLTGMEYSTDYYGFLPGTKLLYWAAACAHMQLIGGTKLFTGYINDNAIGGFRDMNPDFIRDFVALYNHTYVEEPNSTVKAQPITPHSPYRHLNKAEVVIRSVFNGSFHALKYTRTCTSLSAVGAKHCGTCEGCRRRKLGFEIAYENLRNILNPFADPLDEEVTSLLSEVELRRLMDYFELPVIDPTDYIDDVEGLSMEPTNGFDNELLYDNMSGTITLANIEKVLASGWEDLTASV